MARTLALRDNRFQFRKLDPTRIAAESGAIAVHGLALLLLLAPLSPPPHLSAHDDIPPIIVPYTPKKNPLPVDPPKEVEVVRQRLVPATATIAPPKLDVQPMPVVDWQPDDIAIAPEQVAVVDTGRSNAIAGPLEGAHLEYEIAPPPPYPVAAIREHLTGTVTLRVLVDVDGRPIDVQVERSSGHRALDAAARKQVLAKWRFRPATQDGRAVQAIGRVPVVFTLD